MPSQPTDSRPRPSGQNATPATGPTWPSSARNFARSFSPHTSTRPSSPPDAASPPTGEAHALRTQSPWPDRMPCSRPQAVSHSLIVWSWLAVSIVAPSGVNASDDTGQRCAGR